MPSCGAQKFLRLGAPKTFDRYAIFHSLHPPQAAFVKKARHQLEYYSVDYVCIYLLNYKNGGEEGIRTLVACAKRFSRPPRYDRFDTSPCDLAILTQTISNVNTKL